MASPPDSVDPTDSPPESAQLENRPVPLGPVTGTLLWRVGGILRTTRPHQWVKNVFVLAPVVFAKNLFEPRLLTDAFGAFVAFCFLAGAVYTLNDILDVEADRRHPAKRFRPIASGRVPLPVARVMAIVLVVGTLGASLPSLGWPFALVAAAYFGNNLAYSFRLKHVAYLDVVSIAFGFVLRVVAGSLAADIPPSAYLLLCTALLASFLGFGKRRHELAAAANNARRQRAALERYSRRGLDLALMITAATTIGTYVAYTLDPRTRTFFKSDFLWVSTLFVALGVGRFLQLVRSTHPQAESPTQEMLRDGPFVMVVLLWVGLVLWLVYHLQPAVG